MKIAILLCILGGAFALPTVQVASSGSNSPAGAVGPAAKPALTKEQILLAHQAAQDRILAAHRAHEEKLEAIAKVHRFSQSGGRFELAPVNIVPGIDAKGCIVGESGKICPDGSVQFV